MKRVAIIADSHFDEHSRFDECVRVHDWIADDLRERGVDLVLHSGDLYERKSTPRERYAVARWVQRIASLAPMVIARGNHDAIGDLPLLEKLATKHPVHVFEKCGVVDAGGCLVGVLAWPQRSHLHTYADAYSPAHVNAVGVEALRNVLHGLGNEMRMHSKTRTRILLSHAMVRASRVSTGQPLVGADFELGLEDLALARADFYALGHIHLGQDWDVAGAPAVYPGSPRRTAFGELETKGYILAEFDGHAVTWQRIETPARAMLLIDGDWFPESGGHIHTKEAVDIRAVEGAEVRLRYRVDSDQREVARRAAEDMRDVFLTEGAHSVKLDEIVRPTTRARAPEVAKAATLEEKLAALWQSRSWDPGDRRAELVAKANSIEEEVRCA